MYRRVALCVQLLTALCLVFGGHCTVVKQNAALLTRNKAYYEGNFNYTIENFMELPFPESNEGYFFDSATFPSSDEASGLKWHFRVYPRIVRNGQKGLDVDLRLVSLPNNTSFPIITFECGIIDVKGNVRYLKKAPEKKMTLSGGIFINPLITRDALISKASELLPLGHLTLQCRVKGFIKDKHIYHNYSIASEEVSTQLRVHALECGRNLASENMKRLSLLNFNLNPDVVLEASGKQFKRHKAILAAQSSVLGTMIKNTENNLATVLNLGGEMNAVELEDMLNFQYQGTATNLDQTCRTLYVAAKKYQFDCLMATCEEILIGKIQSETVLDLLKYGVKHGAVRLIESVGNFISKFPEKVLAVEI